MKFDVPIEEPKHDKLASDNALFRFDDAPDAQVHSPQKKCRVQIGFF